MTLGSIALSLDVVGVIFLANSMGIRNPRRFISEHFGIEPEQPLRAVHQQLRVKAQIFTGFLFLLMGFSLQLVADVRGVPVVAPAPDDSPVRTLAMLVAGILVASALLRVLQNTWSLAVFRRLLTEFFQEHPDWNFEKHPKETREIGSILGVPAEDEDSIGDYAVRLRSALKLHAGERRAAPDDAFAPIRKLGAERRH